MRVLKLLWIFNDRVVCKCHNDNALFRFFIYRILFRVLSDRILFESSAIQSSSGFAVIDSSLGSPMHFFSHVTIFYQRVLPFFIKNGCFVLDSLYFQKHFHVFKQLQQHWSRKNEWIEAVVRRCSVKKVFLEISQNSLENTFSRVSFFINFIKKGTLAQAFCCEFWKISKNTSGGCFWMRKALHDKDTKDKKYTGNICHQFPDLQLSLNSQLI